MNKFNFWDNTQTVEPLKIEKEGSLNELIVACLNEIKSEEFETNFNKSEDVFYIRFKDRAVRIASKWGEVGNCNWVLNRDANSSKFQSTTIRYNNLKAKITP